MSPLIEEARRRQRRRRIALGAVVLVAAVLAAVVSLLHRESAAPSRQAQPKPKPATVVAAPGAAWLHVTSTSSASGESATVLRTLVLRISQRSGGATQSPAVRVDPGTDLVTVTTTPRP